MRVVVSEAVTAFTSTDHRTFGWKCSRCEHRAAFPTRLHTWDAVRAAAASHRCVPGATAVFAPLEVAQLDAFLSMREARDRARGVAVVLEQENAHLEHIIDEAAELVLGMGLPCKCHTERLQIIVCERCRLIGLLDGSR